MAKGVYKFFVAGLPDSGKTTFVKALSEVKPLDTDVTSSGRKTTVAFDFGLLKLEENIEIHLYGLPGQERFSFMWEILKKGAIGYIYLIPALGYNVESIVSHYEKTATIASLPHVVGITKTDLNPYSKEDIMKIAEMLEIDAGSVILIDPRKKEDAKTALKRLVSRVILMLSK